MTGQPVSHGDYHTLGATCDGDGVNFALFSAHAERVELCLFDESGNQEVARYDLPAQSNEIWHGYVPGLEAGAVYGYRVHGPYDPQAGHRFNHHKLLLDPYAKALRGEFSWSDTHFAYDLKHPDQDLSLDRRDNANFMPKGVVAGPFADSPRARKPQISWSETSIYEAHVRGFTMRHPDVPELERGRFSGLAQAKVIDYLRALGISSIELLPVHAFIDEHFLHQRGLSNYWGYNTLSYFAPHSAYHNGDGIAEFREMVERFHDSGIEVILDVVYNHSCESNHFGPTVSFRGIDNASYYHLQAEQPRYYVNDTGCGNTVNVQHPMVMRLIMDSLRYWAAEMGVDGFRFDLAATLGREKNGFSTQASFLQAVAQDPQLSRCKMIAEPWDIGPGGYQLGKFPAGWSEWNDDYRDTLRRFWTREPGILPTFARRLHGSSDIFEHSGRQPSASINFVTSHDGFTLHDLVSYTARHNHANGEDNHDGHSHNISQNFGVEGPTDDAGIRALRARQQRNMLATLLVSQGVPMLQAGDEFSRTQMGNNNAYCQDNETGWVDWSQADSTFDGDHRAYVGRLLKLRTDYALLRHHRFIHPPQSEDGLKIEWLNNDGLAMSQHQWLEHHRFFLAYKLSAEPTDQPGATVLVVFNNDTQSHTMSLPGTQQWQWLLDTHHQDGVPAREFISLEAELTIREQSVAIFCNTIENHE